jgi:serine/threonine protein kinase
MESHNQRLEALFDAALDLPTDERAAFVDHQCRDDDEMRHNVLGMLEIARRNGPAITTEPGTLPFAKDTIVTPLGHGLRGRARAQAQSALWLEPGSHVHQYEIIRELGRGGMGAVYLARDLKLGRRVAIKLMQSVNSSLTARFLREARATARCSHENIVIIHDVDELRGQPFMVLEYLKGHPLGQVLEDSPVTPSRAIQLMIPVVRALMCAHEHRIVHRDLKPDNIFVTETGAIKVLDFGIAKFLRDVQRTSMMTKPGAHAGATDSSIVLPEPSLTHGHALIGTLPFMSPEQWNQEQVDHRSDIWAVGIILYMMVVGRHPLAPLQGAQLIVTGDLDHPMPSVRSVAPGTPPALADLIDRCLRKRKEERFSEARQLLVALEALVPGQALIEWQGDMSPYTGLAPFQENDAPRFFGRGRDITTLLAWLQDKPLLSVVGPSGVGKSSFVRAGVIPALKQSGERWEACILRPGREPLAALADVASNYMSTQDTTLTRQLSLRQDVLARLVDEPGFLAAVLRSRARQQQSKILLFVDQFEELYTLTPSVEQRAAFTACLTAAADDPTSPLRVILSIRSDFLDRAAEDRHFISELHQGMYFLPQLDRASLHEALIRPAEMVGFRFESAWMVDHMLDSLDTTTGALPLLQFTAATLWERRDRARQLLTEDSYRSIGGIGGALASHADAVLAGLRGDDQVLARSIFLRLVTPERTRAIASIEELCELTQYPQSIQRLIDYLVSARLLVIQSGDTAAGSFVEIVHESLLRTWPTLDRWLDENHEDAIFRDQITAIAKQWDARARPAGLLWRGEAADEARRWLRRYRGPLPRVASEYLDAVSALATRAARTRRMLTVGMVAFLCLFVMGGAVALVRIRTAQRNAVAAAALARDSEQQARANEQKARAAEIEAQDAKRAALEQLQVAQAMSLEARLAELGKQRAENLTRKAQKGFDTIRKALHRELEEKAWLKQEFDQLVKNTTEAWQLAVVADQERNRLAEEVGALYRELKSLLTSKKRLEKDYQKLLIMYESIPTPAHEAKP